MEQNSSGGFDRGQLKDVQSWRRSRSDRMLAGVCGGMGRALNVDPVLIRVVMAVLVLSGPGIIFYLAAWVMMPDEGSDRSAAQGLFGDRVRADHPWLWPVVIGLCVFSAIALMSSFNFGKVLPGPVVVLGLLWLFVFRRKGRNHWGHRTGQWSGHRSTPWTGQPGDQTGGPQYSGPAQTGPLPHPAGQASSATQRPQDRVTEPVQPVWTEDDPLGLYVDEPPAPATRVAAAPPVKGYRGVKSAIVLLTGAALAIAWAASAQPALTLVIGLATLGLGMLFGGFLGKTLALFPLGILLAMGIAASMVFPEVPRDFADVKYVAPAQSQVNATNTTYRFDAGSVQLDLSKATFATGAKVVVDGGVGDVVVKLPPNVDVTGNLVADTGQVDAFSKTQGGHSAKMTLTDLGADGKAGPQSVVLDLHLKLGSIKVER